MTSRRDDRGGEVDGARGEPGDPDARPIDVRAYNRGAWDAAVAAGNRWTVPVGGEVIAAARR